MALSEKTKRQLEVGLASPEAKDDLVAHIDSVAIDQLDADVLRYRDVTLTSAQILALNATPITVLPAPGAGLANIVLGIYGTLDYASATYSASTDTLDFKYTDGSGDLVAQLTNAFLESAADGRAYAEAQAECVPVVNAPVVAHVGNANPTTGDSNIKLRIYYRQVPALLP